METKVKILINIESKIEGIRFDIEISDILFSDFNNLFNSEDILNKYKLAMKKINNSFEMLTISVLNYTDYYNTKTIFSCRYVKRYDEVTRSNFNGTYYNFIASDIKEIKKDILNSIEIGNRNFIETIKKIAA